VICLFPEPSVLDPYLFLAILNSGTFWTLIRHRAPTMGRGQHVYRAAVLKTLPIPVGESNGDHEKIARLVKQMLTNHVNNHERQNLLLEIDKLVAALYGVM